MNYIFKKLWPELAVYRSKIALVLVFGAIASAIKSAIAPLMDRLAQSWANGDQALAYQIPALICLMWIVMSAVRYIHLYWMKYISDLIAVKLRRDLMNKYLSLNIGFFQSFISGSGGLISRMVNDINVIQVGIHKVSDLLREPFMLVFSLGYLIYLDWKLIAFLLLAAPPLSWVLKSIAKSLRKYGHLNQESMEDLTSTLKESLDGTRVVQSFSLENEMRKKFNEKADTFMETRKKIIKREEAAGPITESLAAIMIALILTYLSYQAFQGQFSASKFTAFIFAFGFLMDSSKKLQNGYIKLQQAAVALERLHHILEQTNKVPEPENPKPFPQNWETIEFKDVVFGFDKNKVLNGVNVTVNRGENIAIVGASGSGKSTLVNLLERFFDPQSGDILIGGVSIKDMSLYELRRHIGLVTQDVFLFSDTIENNIKMGDLEKQQDVIEAAKLANAHSFVSQFPNGYKTNVGDRGGLISGGEKQRISIARAIFKNAPILILDEATSALDSASELEVQKGLNQLMKGKTSFVIAHRLSTIINADRILVFNKGNIVEQGNHLELITQKGEYFKYYEMQTSSSSKVSS